jgi:hypothetical protein
MFKQLLKRVLTYVINQIRKSETLLSVSREILESRVSLLSGAGIRCIASAFTIIQKYTNLKWICKQKLHIKLSYIFVINLIIKFFNSCIIQSRMPSFSVVPNFNVFKDFQFHLFFRN